MGTTNNAKLTPITINWSKEKCYSEKMLSCLGIETQVNHYLNLSFISLLSFYSHLSFIPHKLFYFFTLQISANCLYVTMDCYTTHLLILSIKTVHHKNTQHILISNNLPAEVLHEHVLYSIICMWAWSACRLV